MALPIANLFDDFNDGVIDTAKWTVVSGTWTEPSGSLCVLMPSGGSALNSADVWSLRQSSAFLEIVSIANGAGAASGATIYRLINSADSNDYVQFIIDPPSGNLFMQYVENAVVQSSATITYNATTMRWLRFRHINDLVYFETSPDGTTWTPRLTSAEPAWVDSVRVLLFAAQSGGAAITKCFDNFNIASASARAVPVGSEFTVSTDGRLGLNRCDQPDVAWGFSCSESAYNALRRSSDPCGLWVQPPSKQLVAVEAVVTSTSAQDEQTLITLELTNPDTCRSMLFYLPLTAGMKMVSSDNEDTGIFNWTLGVQVTGVDNPDSGFTPVTANDFGIITGVNATHLWRGEADYFWTADPGASTTVEVKLKAFAGGGDATLSQLQARLGYIGMSVMEL